MNSYELINESTIPVQQSNIPQQYPANPFPQQFTTFTTYPPGVNPNQPLPFANQPQQQFTTVTTYPPGVNPNQPLSYPLGVNPNQPLPFANQPQQPVFYPVQAAPVVFQEVPTPVIIQETPAPVVIQQNPAPVIIQETPAPVVVQQNPAPVEEIPLDVGEVSYPLTEEKPFLEKAKETLYEAGEKMGPYVGKAKETLHQAGQTLGIVKPAQNIEGPLSEIQEVRVEMGMSKMEQPFHKPLTERAKESINQTSVKVAPYTEKAKEILHQTGEQIGIIKPAQNIEGPLSEIQEVRVEMGMTKMEQPYQKSFAEIAAETWNEAGEMLGPYAEIAKDTFYEAKDTLHVVGEKIGIVYPHQKIQGPLAEIQDVRKSMGKPRMDQPLWKPVDEMTYTDKTRETFYEAKDTLNEVSQIIEPYAEKAFYDAKDTLHVVGENAKDTFYEAKDTLNEVGQIIEPYAEKAFYDAKDTLHVVGEKIGVVYPRQKIEGPLAEIQDVRKEMGKTKMEQPVQISLTERAKESFNQTSEKIAPYTEKAKETLVQAGEKVGNIVKPAPTVEAIPVDLHDVRLDMGWEQQAQRPLVNETLIEKNVTIEKDNGTLFTTEEIIGIVNPNHNNGGSVEVRYEVEEIIDQPVNTLTDSAVRNTWNEAGENIELGKQMGFVNNTQNIEGPLIPQVSEIHENIGLQQQQQQQQQQHPMSNANEKMELFAEKARQKMARFSNQVGLSNTTGYPAGVQNWQQGQNWESAQVGLTNNTGYPVGAQNLQQGQNWESAQVGLTNNTGYPVGAQNWQQGQNWESENPKRGPGFEDVRMTKVTENIVETQTTKTLPA